MDGIHISLAAETIGHIGGFPVTNTLIMSWIVMAILICFAVFMYTKATLIPGKFQTLLEWMIEGVYDFIERTLENRDMARRVFPLLITLFLFIAVANMIEFTPGIGSMGFYRQSEHAEVVADVPQAHEEAVAYADEGSETAVVHAEGEEVVSHTEESHTEFVPLLRSMNTDLNVTLALTIITVIFIEVMGVIALGFFRYTGKFINFSGHSIAERLLNFVVGLIELVSEISRLVSFSFRLFGNIFAGEVLIAVAAFFAPYVLPVPLMAFETFVGFVQAAVFALLALFFIKMAIAMPHTEHAKAH